MAGEISRPNLSKKELTLVSKDKDVERDVEKVEEAKKDIVEENYNPDMSAEETYEAATRIDEGMSPLEQTRANFGAANIKEEDLVREDVKNLEGAMVHPDDSRAILTNDNGPAISTVLYNEAEKKAQLADTEARLAKQEESQRLRDAEYEQQRQAIIDSRDPELERALYSQAVVRNAGMQPLPE